MSTVLSVDNIHKHFGRTHAVRGLSFDIPEGICLGLLGPNGAGKTTTIEMLEGIKSIDSGTIYYRNQALRGALLQRYKHRIGIQFQSTALMDYLSVREVLALFGSFYKRPIATDELISLCHLGEFQHSTANRVSGGQKQRLLLAIALVNDPDILFLDEPTTGLDPQSRRNFWQLIETIKQRGKTIVLTTHYMDEAEILCDDLLIIDHGSIIASGSPKALLTEHFEQQRIYLDHTPSIAIAPKLGTVSSANGQTIVDTNQAAALLDLLVQQQVNLDGLQIKTPTLEDLFLKLTGHNLRS